MTILQARYVRNQIKTEPRLRQWPVHIKQNIEETVMKKSDGMSVPCLPKLRRWLANFKRFRWVVCQIDILKKCISIGAIGTALDGLLDETYGYERIVQNIPEEYQEQLQIALKWLLCSESPLSIEEIAEAITWEPESDDLSTITRA